MSPTAAGRTEIYDTDIDRVDAVNGPATGLPFLILKAADPDVPDTTDIADDVNEKPKVDGTVVNPDRAGDANVPGSATWEAVDAATAREAVKQLVALRKLVAGLAAREQTEADTNGDCDDEDNAWDLSDAASQIDWVLGVLAKFAVDEQTEADDVADEAKAEARAAGLIKSLFTEPVVKAGRVLSTQNEAALRSAAQSINSILQQLDTAPVAAEGGEPMDESAVAKSTEPAEQALAEVTDALRKAQDPATPLPTGLSALLSEFVTAYQSWQAAGVTPDPVVDANAPAPDPAVPDPSTTQPADPAATSPATGSAPAAPAAPQTPAAPAAPTVPDPNLQPQVAKSLVDQLADDIRAQLGQLAEAQEAVRKRLEQVEATPVNAGPMLRGATPSTTQEPARTPQDELRKALDSAASTDDYMAVLTAKVADLQANPFR